MKKFKLKPYTFIVRTTERCNVGCYHCSISATPKGEDVFVDLAIAAIKDAHSYGIQRVHFTGGEPLLYDNLGELISTTQDLGMSSDLTTSTFTSTSGETIDLLDSLSKKGLECVMLSYDEPHSRKVSIDHFVKFAKRSQELNLHICVFVTEGGNTTFKLEDLKEILLENQINIDSIEWTISDFQYEGRGEKYYSEGNTSTEEIESNQFCRCPYVMAVPTLNPNGDILLCHMSRLKSKNFILGKYPDESLDSILNRLQDSPIYRYLAKYGPQKSLLNLGESTKEIPKDMCRACERYLTMMEAEENVKTLEKIASEDDLTDIEVDFDGIMPIYQRFISELGEKLETSNPQ